jgi:hypothetical protein
MLIESLQVTNKALIKQVFFMPEVFLLNILFRDLIKQAHPIPGGIV